MKLIFAFTLTFLALLFIFFSKSNNEHFDASKLHHTNYGFVNPYLKSINQKKKFSDLLNMMKTERPNPNFKSVDLIKLDELNKKINNKKNFITWIGHSTMLLHIEGKIILTDPIFSERCSPVQFVGPKRYTPASTDIKKLPKIDVVLISHHHYDHLDKNSVRVLSRDTATIWFVPLGLKKWLSNENVKKVVELDWLDKYVFQNIVVNCLPSQHWSKRNIFKSFDTLWASWSVKIGDFNFWFAGDTGYNEIQFKEIGDQFGPFDLSAIPIGAYEPRWFMKNFHINPEESILIHKDVKSVKSIGMHFGTFVLTTEPIEDPINKMNEIMENDSSIINQFIVPKHGVLYDL